MMIDLIGHMNKVVWENDPDGFYEVHFAKQPKKKVHKPKPRWRY